jgi:hypothetical protein
MFFFLANNADLVGGAGSCFGRVSVASLFALGVDSVSMNIFLTDTFLPCSWL